MRSLGIDYGSKRVGISLSDEGGVVAFPHSVLKNSESLLKEVLELCDKEGVVQVVIGESKNFKGVRNTIMDAVDAFITTWRKESALPIYLEPEFLTSYQAEQIQGKNDKLDASAAAIILQSYLDKQKN